MTAPLTPLVTPQARPMAAIMRATAEAAGLDPGALRGPDRRRRVAWPRQVAMALCRARGATLGEIGLAFRRDHTTVIHALGAVAGRMTDDLAAEMRAIAARAEAILREGEA
jgi:chromosomal replication initiation ATPase DnaA